jgi:hypothetical protein
VTTDGLRTMAGNFRLGANYIGNDGGNEGLSFDSSGNATFSGNVMASSATAANITLRHTQAGSYSRFMVQNDLAANVYGQILSYGSTSAGSGFGVSLANYSVVTQVGSSGSGLIVGTENNKPLIFGTSNAERGRFDTSGNLLLGTTTAGTNAAKVLALGAATAPSSSPADVTQVYSADVAAGDAGLHIRTEMGKVHKFADAVFLNGNVGIGENVPDGDLHIAPAGEPTHGGYVHKIYAATSGTLTGATDTIDINVPTGWVIRSCQLHVKVAVTDDAGDYTWSAELHDGGTEEAIVSGAAAAINTNVNHFAHADAGYGGTLTDATTVILLTPNGGNFSAGEIEGHCIAYGFGTWAND